MEKTPWAGTANMMVRNSALQFDTCFIKTGGGEDIDYCLQLKKWPMICVPQAKAIHPWWHNGNRCYGHFYRWAIGDSNLMNKYPKLTYRSCPNVWEMTLLLLLFIPLLGYLQTVGYIVIIWLSDILMDVSRNMFVLERYQQHSVRGWIRLFASFESNVVKNSCELGHLIGPLMRGEWTNITRRFDWFCGMLPNVTKGEQWKNFQRFMVFVITLLAVHFYF